MIFIDFFANQYIIISGSLSKENDDDFFVIDFLYQNKLKIKFLELLFKKLEENNTQIIGYNLYDSLRIIKKIIQSNNIYNNFFDIKYFCKIFNNNDNIFDFNYINELLIPFKKIHNDKFSETFIPKFVINKITKHRIQKIKEFYKNCNKKEIEDYNKYSNNIYKIYDNCSFLQDQKIYFDNDLLTVINSKKIKTYSNGEKNYFYNEYNVYSSKTGRYTYTTFNFPTKIKLLLNGENDKLKKIDYNAFELCVAMNITNFDFDNIEGDIYKYFLTDNDENRSSFKINMIKLLYDNVFDDTKDVANDSLKDILKLKKYIIKKYKKEKIIYNLFNRPLKLINDEESYKIFSHYIQSSANDLMMNILYELRNKYLNLKIKECQYDSLYLDCDSDTFLSVFESMKNFRNIKLFPRIK